MHSVTTYSMPRALAENNCNDLDEESFGCTTQPTRIFHQQRAPIGIVEQTRSPPHRLKRKRTQKTTAEENVKTTRGMENKHCKKTKKKS